MRKLAVGFVLLMSLPVVGMAEEKAAATPAAPDAAQPAVAVTPAAPPAAFPPGYQPVKPSQGK